jgi:3-carboxy-cis,cis-muconate cycloisomerase
MTASVFDHPILSGLLGDDESADCFSLEAELSAMLAFEIALVKAEAAEGIIPERAAKAVAEQLGSFRPNVIRLREGAARDGVAVPELVRQLREAVGKEHAEYVHFGATSQDVVDTALAVRLDDTLRHFSRELEALTDALAALGERDGEIEVMAHTRMQAAIPVRAARKIASWRAPLERDRERLEVVRKNVAILHFGGAAGTLDKVGNKGPAVASHMSRGLGLSLPEHARHSERDAQAELASWLSLVTGSLGKMGQDIALMAQSEIGEIRLANAGGSSAMPHKQNPVAAEVLIALARFNATLLSGMHQALVHENERSGAAWTLEWMLLPQMVMAAGAAMRVAGELVAQISFAPAATEASPRSRS